MRILIGVDGSPYSDAALDEVAQRKWPEGSEIRVVHAFQLPLAPTPEVWVLQQDYYEKINREIETQSDAIVQAAIGKLRSRPGSSLTIEGKAILGSAKRVLLDEAESWNADLIVVGSHGYPTWERLLLGSVSQAVVSHAKCSVEVVRLPHANKIAA
ncbi:MAG TPA: universal stress protein [Pyrinomonadaceae bacterium]|jgi:nucleotide-binding universal stress UspA family protein|nr:universal stress protein [Pyrinomonadaceae bacterium]